jgi:hypothetical protein
MTDALLVELEKLANILEGFAKQWTGCAPALEYEKNVRTLRQAKAEIERLAALQGGGDEKASVHALGETIGYGNMIQLAHKCWDELLEAKHGIKGHSRSYKLIEADLIRANETKSPPSGEVERPGTTPEPSSPDTVEKVAELIDPTAFCAGFDPDRGAVQNDIDHACEVARAKARAILASLSLRGGKGSTAVIPGRAAVQGTEALDPDSPHSAGKE